MSAGMVVVPAAGLADRTSFHGGFKKAFGFPDFCGRDMDAWTRCLPAFDAPGGGGPAPVTVDPGDVVVSGVEDA